MKKARTPISSKGKLDAPLASVALDILLEHFPVPGAEWSVFASPTGDLIAQLAHPQAIGLCMARLLPGRTSTEEDGSLGPLAGAPLAWTETVRGMVRALRQPTQARDREVWISRTPQVSHVLADPLAELGYEIGQALGRGHQGSESLTSRQALQIAAILRSGAIFDVSMTSQRDGSTLPAFLGARRRRIGRIAESATFELDLSGTYDPRTTDAY